MGGEGGGVDWDNAEGEPDSGERAHSWAARVRKLVPVSDTAASEMDTEEAASQMRMCAPLPEHAQLTVIMTQWCTTIITWIATNE